jgi:hypothetical protein
MSSASIPQTSPFKLYSQIGFGCDLKIGQPTHFHFNLLQQQQQALQAGHLKQQLCLKLQHSGSQQLQRLRVTWSLIWGALLVAAVVAVLLAFTPLGRPMLPHQHQSWSSQTAVHHRAAGMVRFVRCRLWLIAVLTRLQNQAGPPGAAVCSSGPMWTLASLRAQQEAVPVSRTPFSLCGKSCETYTLIFTPY